MQTDDICYNYAGDFGSVHGVHTCSVGIDEQVEVSSSLLSPVSWFSAEIKNTKKNHKLSFNT